MDRNGSGSTLDELIAGDMKDAKFRASVERKIAEIELEQVLARLRTKVGLSQAQLAKRLAKSQPWIAAAETRPAANMQISTLVRLVTATGGSVEIVVRDPKGKKVGAVQVSA